MTPLREDVTLGMAGDIEVLIRQGRYIAAIGCVVVLLAIVAAGWLV